MPLRAAIRKPNSNQHAYCLSRGIKKPAVRPESNPWKFLHGETALLCREIWQELDRDCFRSISPAISEVLIVFYYLLLTYYFSYSYICLSASFTWKSRHRNSVEHRTGSGTPAGCLLDIVSTRFKVVLLNSICFLIFASYIFHKLTHL